jgi:adenylate cyclase
MSASPEPRAQLAQRVLTFLSELKRRKVYVSIVAYAAISIGVIELGGAIVEALQLPEVTAHALTILLVLGFPVVVVLAWIFDVTTQGLKRTEPLPAKPARPAAAARRLDAAAASGAAAVLPEIPAGTARARLRGNLAPAVEATDDDAVPDAQRVERAALGHIRHELRTPVNGIIGYAEMLLEDAQDPAIEEDLKRIRAAGGVLLARIEEVLGGDVLRPDDATPALEAFAARVNAELRTPVSTVKGYAEMLIETCREQARDDLVPDLERILAAARKLLETSSGIVDLATGAAADSVIADTAAMTRQVLAGIRPVEPGSLSVEGEGTVLVVDDNAMNRDLLLRQLARNGYIVDAAVDGIEALERLAGRAYDVVLLDVLMPRLNGIETLRRIRADERLQDLPVLMLSSLDEVDSAIRCIEMGAEEYLPKPIQPTLLAARIAANVALRRMRARERAYADHLASSRDAVERLMRAAFPASVATRVLRGEGSILDTAAAATVVACVLHRQARTAMPQEYVPALARLAASIEEACAQYGAGASVARAHGATILLGFPEADADHAGTAAALALHLLQAVPECAIGMHSGAVVGGVVGSARPHYGIWGDTVETAEALAHAAAAGSAVASPTAHSMLRERYSFRSGAVTEVPGHGHMRSFLLLPVEEAPLTT